MKLHALTGKEAREDSAAGELVLEGKTGETASAGGARLWAWRIADPFYIDLSLLAKVNGAVKSGTAVDLSAWRPENAKNSFAGTMVESIGLGSPSSIPNSDPAPVLASGAPPNSPRTRAAGGRSIGAVIP